MTRDIQELLIAIVAASLAIVCFVVLCTLLCGCSATITRTQGTTTYRVETQTDGLALVIGGIVGAWREDALVTAAITMPQALGKLISSPATAIDNLTTTTRSK